jgi:L-alanine-DL-glutamate epimerase-like enolase superfamily enzyme
MRVPLKFGPEVTESVVLARVRLRVRDAAGRTAYGWGETPLVAQWAWVSDLSISERTEAMQHFCVLLAERWADFSETGHPVEVGYSFAEHVLPRVLAEFNGQRNDSPMPWLAALICCSAFDIALHDAYGTLHQVPAYETYGPDYMNRDLASYLEPAEGSSVSFHGQFPEDYLVRPRKDVLPAWHLVGGLDPLDGSDLSGAEPDDGYPVTLREWIERDGLTCLKIKLRGTDAVWDYDRLVRVAQIGSEAGVRWLTADFNCTVKNPAYVNDILDRLRDEHPRTYGMVLYVEQPFPYDLETNRIDTHSLSARKPLFMDESAHDWRLVKLGYSLGWSGVALKTCKTQSGALLALCWAKSHGMGLMVQDLTNPALAMIPHALLAAHAGTIMGVETNACQFYPEASLPEQEAHPGLYRRRNGHIALHSLRGPGFGYRLGEIQRTLPEPSAVHGV